MTIAVRTDRETIVRYCIEELRRETRGTVDLEVIGNCVREAIERLDGARVRDYLPVLTLRMARDHLRSRGLC